MEQRVAKSVGQLIKDWRARRRLSQLDFALQCGISQRHLSFVESGRSNPSRDMLMHLAENLSVPLRERNAMLISAGYAPIYRARPIDHSSLQPAKDAIDLLLSSHDPYPAIALDRHWNVVLSNDGAKFLMEHVQDVGLLNTDVNVIRLSLHPGGLAPNIINFAQWRHHLLTRLKQQISVTADVALSELLAEVESYDTISNKSEIQHIMQQPEQIFVPLMIKTRKGELSFFSTTTVFGTPLDIQLSEIAIEMFSPVDEATRLALQLG